MMAPSCVEPRSEKYVPVCPPIKTVPFSPGRTQSLGAAARTAAKLTLAVAPIEGAVHVCAFDPDAAQLIAVLHAVVLGLRSGDLLGTLRGSCFGGQAFFLLTGCLGGFTGGAGSLLLGGFGGLAGSSGTGRSGSFGSFRRFLR